MSRAVPVDDEWDTDHYREQRRLVIQNRSDPWHLGGSDAFQAVAFCHDWAFDGTEWMDRLDDLDTDPDRGPRAWLSADLEVERIAQHAATRVVLREHPNSGPVPSVDPPDETAPIFRFDPGPGHDQVGLDAIAGDGGDDDV